MVTVERMWTGLWPGRRNLQSGASGFFFLVLECRAGDFLAQFQLKVLSRNPPFRSKFHVKNVSFSRTSVLSAAPQTASLNFLAGVGHYGEEDGEARDQ